MPADSLRFANGLSPQGDIPAQHWQGGSIRCGDCDYANLRAMDGEQGCEPGHACMQDVYARRIDRFFRWHPALSDAQLNHAYFEVRAIAARRASLFHLTALMDDPDETVRQRLPVPLLSCLYCDTDWRVRWEVAQRADATPIGVAHG